MVIFIEGSTCHKSTVFGKEKHVSILKYNGSIWRGTYDKDDTSVVVSLPDRILQKHITKILADQGVSTLTYLQLMEYINTVLAKRFEAITLIDNPDYWLSCDDPEVIINVIGGRIMSHYD